MNSKLCLAFLGAVGLLAGCSDSKPGVTIDLSKATLRRATSCDDLSSGLRDDARSKMNRRIDAEIRAIREGWNTNGYGTGGYDSAQGGPNAAGGAQPTPSAASPSAPAPAHSDTETQVKGVDEADIVKTDGNHIYLLHGDKLVLVDSWPVTSLAAKSELSIEGRPLEMFVANGRAVIFSTVEGKPIYDAAHVAPRAGYTDDYAPGGYGGGGAAMPPSSGGSYGGGPAYTAPLTKMTIVQLNGDAQPSVTRELWFEGSYLTSRRVDGKVRAILNGGAHGPQLAYSPVYPQAAPSQPTQNNPYTPPSTDQQIAAWEIVRAKNEGLIAGTQFGDWIPTSFAKNGDAIGATATSCTDYYVPTPGTTEAGMTRIESIDLDDPAASARETAIVGMASTVYGNANALVLAGRAYVDPWEVREAYEIRSNANAYNDPSKTPPVMTLDYTHLHLFDLTQDPSTAAYAGSGTVPGDVKDQFALDESNGFVRVATTEQRSGGAPSQDGMSNEVSHVYVLTNHQGKLDITGDAGEIAPGEQLYATRFVGSKAYIVTWHVTDPLFVVDVGDPNNAKVLGQVQIPGFSTYIHPLDETHLLTIGRETDMTGHQHDGNQWYGIAIQVFDVTDPLAPNLQHKFVYDGGEYATTEAMDDHKAFTYFDDKKLLAFPYVHNGTYGASGPSSTLEVFKVGVAEGITKVGSVDHSALVPTMPNGNYGYCGGYFDGAVRRGIFVENVVYSISYGGIVASDVGAMAKPVNTLKLEAPTQSGVSCGPEGGPTPAGG